MAPAMAAALHNNHLMGCHAYREVELQCVAPYHPVCQNVVPLKAISCRRMRIQVLVEGVSLICSSISSCNSPEPAAATGLTFFLPFMCVNMQSYFVFFPVTEVTLSETDLFKIL